MTDYFALRRTLVAEDGCLVQLESHWDTHFFSGEPLGELTQPIHLSLDADTNCPGHWASSGW